MKEQVKELKRAKNTTGVRVENESFPTVGRVLTTTTTETTQNVFFLCYIL